LRSTICWRHHPVAQELIDGAAVTLDLLGEDLVVGKEEGFDVFGVQDLGACGEVHEVAEHDRDDLPFLGHRTGGDGVEGGHAEATEREAVGILLRA
jgi:hypothetical protein